MVTCNGCFYGTQPGLFRVVQCHVRERFGRVIEAFHKDARGWRIYSPLLAAFDCLPHFVAERFGHDGLRGVTRQRQKRRDGCDSGFHFHPPLPRTNSKGSWNRLCFFRGLCDSSSRGVFLSLSPVTIARFIVRSPLWFTNAVGGRERAAHGVCELA